MGFQRTIEDFECEHCGTKVAGDGYTNHCPKCLWSKHVDIVPGDRAAECGGMMKPVSIEGSTPEYIIMQCCSNCGHIRKNKVQREDSVDAVLALVQEQVSKV